MNNSRAPLTVVELIKFLQTQPQDVLVMYQCCSENVLLDACEIHLVNACEPRPDGWVQDARPDMPSRTYLRFPGN